MVAMLVALVIGGAAFVAARAILPGLADALARIRGARAAVAAALPVDRPVGMLDRLLAGRRRQRMRGQLPAALQAVATSVRAGLSLPQALQAAGRQVPAPLGEEFARIAEETALGATLDRALESFEARVALPDVRLLVASLSLSRATGASLAPLLDRLVETLRERERLRGQVQALTAQGRMSGWVVGLAPVGLLAAMAVADPEYLRPMIATPAGWFLLGLAALLEVLGAVTIRAMVRVEA